jgi:PBP1b-binding outer membrane lipoprotein LpoB
MRAIATSLATLLLLCLALVLLQSCTMSVPPTEEGPATAQTVDPVQGPSFGTAFDPLDEPGFVPPTVESIRRKRFADMTNNPAYPLREPGQ